MTATEKALRRLKAMRFFPSDPDALGEIADLFRDLCKTDEEFRHLTDSLLRNHNEWPGLVTVRELHVSEIAARRSGATWPAACDECTGGYRDVVQVFRQPIGEHRSPETVILLAGSKLEQMNQRSKVLAEYGGSKTHAAYTAVTFCGCALGQRRKDARVRIEAERLQ